MLPGNHIGLSAGSGSQTLDTPPLAALSFNPWLLLNKYLGLLLLPTEGNFVANSPLVERDEWEVEAMVKAMEIAFFKKTDGNGSR